MSYFVHSQALCESKNIGPASRIWAFTHILPQAIIGSDCNICDHVFIENDVRIGNRVTIKSGVSIWDGIEIQDDVFIGPNVAFTNDKFPRSKKYPDQFAKTIIYKNASIGANATLLPGITIGMNAMVGAGSVVTTSVPANAIVVGNPAKVVSFNNTNIINIEQKDFGAKLHQLPVVTDARGQLTFGEFEQSVPFKAKRYFIVYNVKCGETRGEHAHKNCHQFLICLNGSCHVFTDDGTDRVEFILNSPTKGLYISPGIWSAQYKHSSDAILLVFASEYYPDDDYIRDYEEFLTYKSNIASSLQSGGSSLSS